MLMERKVIVGGILEVQELTRWTSIAVKKCIFSSLELSLLPSTEQPGRARGRGSNVKVTLQKSLLPIKEKENTAE